LLRKLRISPVWTPTESLHPREHGRQVGTALVYGEFSSGRRNRVGPWPRFRGAASCLRLWRYPAWSHRWRGGFWASYSYSRSASSSSVSRALPAFGERHASADARDVAVDVLY
jgi:hypothetical protein